jgi:hypothetical protein
MKGSAVKRGEKLSGVSKRGAKPQSERAPDSALGAHPPHVIARVLGITAPGIKTTPAMAAGVADHVWKVSEIVALLVAREAQENA